MPDITLPKARLPEGLRDLTREDIQRAIPEIRPPHVELPKMELPRGMPKVDVSKAALPKGIESRMPGRRRRSPFPAIFAIAAVLAAATWLVMASPFAPRIRRAVDDARTRMGMGGQPGTDELGADFGSSATGYAAPSSFDTPSPAVDTYRSAVGVGPGFDGQHEGDTPQTPM